MSNYIGQNVTVEFVVSDCNGRSHQCHAYIDCSYADCNNSPTAQVEWVDSSCIVYPNPLQERFTLKSRYNIDEVSITDLTGERMYTNMPGTKEIDLRLNLRGCYFVHVRCGGRVAVKKILIN